MRKMKPIHRLYIKLRGLFIPDGPSGDRRRGKLYEPFLKSYGKNFKIGTQAFIYNPNELTVGDDVYIGFNSYLGQGIINLNDQVLIGNFVSITASNHLKKDNSFRFGGFEGKPVNIGLGTWIGAHSSILSGVTVGKGVLVAAGSVVTKNLEDHAVYAGVPAKKIK